MFSGFVNFSDFSFLGILGFYAHCLWGGRPVQLEVPFQKGSPIVAKGTQTVGNRAWLLWRERGRAGGVRDRTKINTKRSPAFWIAFAASPIIVSTPVSPRRSSSNNRNFEKVEFCKNLNFETSKFLTIEFIQSWKFGKRN